MDQQAKDAKDQFEPKFNTFISISTKNASKRSKRVALFPNDQKLSVPHLLAERSGNRSRCCSPAKVQPGQFAQVDKLIQAAVCHVSTIV
jgi:hypothetical protein